MEVIPLFFHVLFAVSTASSHFFFLSSYFFFFSFQFNIGIVLKITEMIKKKIFFSYSMIISTYAVHT